MNVKPTLLLLGLGCSLAIGSASHAQLTVQLPTVRFFNIRTVVSVPDGGTMNLGGVGRSAYGRTSRSVPGLGSLPGVGRGFRNTAVGSSAGGSSVQVHPRILIMSEIEQEVLSEAERRRALRGRGNEDRAAVRRKADFITRHIGRNRKR